MKNQNILHNEVAAEHYDCRNDLVSFLHLVSHNGCNEAVWNLVSP